MPYRKIIVVVLALILAGQASVAAAVHSTFGETRDYFRDWLAACRNDGSGYCSVLAYVRDPKGPGGIAAQLRVARPRPGADLEIVVTPVIRFADVGQPMTVRVDDNAEITLPPQSGFARAGGLNDYRIVDKTAKTALLPQMKNGRSFSVKYMDDAGERARLTFSLMGLTAALDFIDRVRTTTGEAVPGVDPESPRHDTGGPGALRCGGNEPFWTLTLDGTEGLYSRPTEAMPPRAHPLKGAMKVRAYFKPPLFVWRGRGKLASGDIVAMITGEHCLDTMSDGEGRSVFDYTVRVSMPNGELLVGCCEAAPVTDSDGPDG